MVKGYYTGFMSRKKSRLLGFSLMESFRLRWKQLLIFVLVSFWGQWLYRIKFRDNLTIDLVDIDKLKALNLPMDSCFRWYLKSLGYSKEKKQDRTNLFWIKKIPCFELNFINEYSIPRIWLKYNFLNILGAFILAKDGSF